MARVNDRHDTHVEDGLHAEEVLRDRRRRDGCRDGPHEHEGREVLRELLQAEDHAGERRVEGRCEARARTGRQQVMALRIRAVREAPEPLTEAGAELDARALAAERHARADAEHRTRELQHEDARPVHIHLAEQDALDLRDA